MSSDLPNAPASFMDQMEKVFQSYLDSIFIVFIDDILIYTKNEGKHMDHLRVVLQVLKEHQLFVKYRKYTFRLRSVPFLCHTICSEGVEVNTKNIEVVNNWPRPLASMDIRIFLDLAGHYRRFDNSFASLVSPLTTLTQKNVKFECS